MVQASGAQPGQFCWVDLAATDAGAAQAFYGQLFGWSCGEQAANGGHFTRLKLSDKDVGSMYQLSAAHRERGVPSHWTPYVRVDDVELAARRAAALGGQVLVQPFAVSGVARIALILDPVGAHVGLWEPLNADEGKHG
jgi:uncharacterized protein